LVSRSYARPEHPGFFSICRPAHTVSKSTERSYIGVLAIAAAVAGLAYMRWWDAPANLGSLLDDARAPPPADAKGLWVWVAAAPGMNIYVAHRRTESGDERASAWVKREYFRSAAGIDKDLLELHEFDCSHNTSRQLLRGERRDDSVRSSARTMSAWSAAAHGTSEERVLLLVCKGRAPRSALQLRQPSSN
jgi:hypothetical protein